jgi:hypothetical protein
MGMFIEACFRPEFSNRNGMVNPRLLNMRRSIGGGRAEVVSDASPFGRN